MIEVREGRAICDIFNIGDVDFIINDFIINNIYWNVFSKSNIQKLSPVLVSLMTSVGTCPHYLCSPESLVRVCKGHHLYCLGPSIHRLYCHCGYLFVRPMTSTLLLNGPTPVWRYNRTEWTNTSMEIQSHWMDQHQYGDTIRLNGPTPVWRYNQTEWTNTSMEIQSDCLNWAHIYIS